MDRGVLDLAVAEADLRRRKGGAALGPPPDDLLAAVEEALPLQLGQRPPDAFDVGAAVGHIGVFEVHPVADAVGHLLPVADVAEDARLALLDETADAELLDPGAAADPELLLDLHLDRQPVGVPAGDPLHPTPAHGPVAGEDVLEDAGQDMPVVGPPVRGRGAVVPHPGHGRGAPGDAPGEDPALFPEPADLRLPGGDLRDRAGGPEEGHSALGGGPGTPAPDPVASPTGLEPVFSP